MSVFDSNDEKRRAELLDECLERGLPVLGEDSIEALEAMLSSDNEDLYDEELLDELDEDEQI